MANNRLYLVDTLTGDKTLLFKSMGNGWYFYDHEKTTDWLAGRDWDASYGNGWAKTRLALEGENDKNGFGPTLPEQQKDLTE